MKKPEQIGTAIAERALSTATSAALSKTSRSPEISRIFEQHGDAKNFMIKFNPSMNDTYCKNFLERCFVGTAPSLYWVGKAYGDKVANAWVKNQLSSYIIKNTTKAEQMMDEKQLEDIAKVISDKWSWLKVTEFMVFLRELEAGTLGELYGVLTGYKIGIFMQKFIKYRAKVLDDINRRKELQKAKAYQEKIKSGQTMDYNQWQRFKAEHPDKVALLAKLGCVEPQKP